MLIDRNMKKGALFKLSGISNASITKIGKTVALQQMFLIRLCTALECNIEDIMEIIKE